MNTLAEQPPVISMRQAERAYPGPPPVVAVTAIDLTVQQGEYVAITGPSGSGKSTLLNLVGLLDRPTAGSYELAGQDVAVLSQAELAALRGQRIGFVFQEFYLLPYRTAIENVMLGLLYGQHRRSFQRASMAMAALDRVGLARRMYALPTQLSGGERQRVAFARAIVNWPSLLLCDEPTGNLDSVTAEAILGLVSELHGAGQTVLVVTHSEAVAHQAQRRLVMLDGRLREERSTLHAERNRSAADGDHDGG
jgi:putative ABC transport system ATP-binding protein